MDVLGANRPSASTCVEQKRFFEFADDRLILKTPPLMVFGETQVHRLIWQRLWDLRV
jgi:hypothetical protein